MRGRGLRSRFTGIAMLAGVAMAASCTSPERVGFSGDVQALLTRGQAYARTLPSRPAHALSSEEIVALGYLERARLGIGSPFRLIDFALRDPDLGPATRERLAYAILHLTLSGDIYQVDPVVLEPTRFFGVQPWAQTGPGQLALIQRTIEGAVTAGSGERAARLGYRIAETEHTIHNVPHTAVTRVAALVADRRRARTDARLLLRAAARSDTDPLVLLPTWRRQLRFAVERPALGGLRVAEEEEVARSAPRMARSLGALALRLVSPGASPGGVQEARAGYLDGEAAARLLELSAERDFPAQAPVAVAVAIMRDGYLDDPELLEGEREARARFADAAYNEERLVAAAALLRSQGAAGARLSLIQIQVATFLRAWSQEEPWFPGDPAPSARDLMARFRLASIEFDPAVPDGWRPYALRSLGRGLTDLQRVLPTASVRGLNVRFGPVPRDGRALALHDPRTRTLYLPLESGAGTLAHEIAHDLDWQLARLRYGVRGGYATDLAVRRGSGDRIASSVSELSAAFRRPGVDTLIDSHDTRPAEVFARGSDWFIAAALAREGRTGGFLSSFQDPALTGYGSTRGPDIGGGAVVSLLAILDAVAPVPPETRAWARAELGPTRTLTPTELATAVLHAGAAAPAAERFPIISTARDRSLSSVTAASCRFSSAEGMRRLATAQRELILHSAASAARGAAVQAIRDLAAERLGPGDRRVDQWLAWRVLGAPEPADSALTALGPAFEDLLSRARIVAADRSAPAASPFRARGQVAPCGRNPFAAPPAGAPGTFGAPLLSTDSARGSYFRF